MAKADGLTILVALVRPSGVVKLLAWIRSPALLKLPCNSFSAAPAASWAPMLWQHAQSAGKVRKECVEGLKRAAALRRVEWSRQVAGLSLLPTSAMLILLDKKFGGELTEQDVHVSLCCLHQLALTAGFSQCYLNSTCGSSM